MLCYPIEVAAMKIAALLAVATVLFASSAFAQSRPPTTSAPPPPGMNDPGVQPATSPAPDSARKPALQDPDNTGDAKHMSLPEVSVHQDGENEVQEYRRSGFLYMVVVTPQHGIPQTYNVDPDGTRHLQPGETPVRPVMYKVLEWGKSKPAEAGSTEAPDDGG
jgi:Protein of unknown function (DUF2782)